MLQSLRAHCRAYHRAAYTYTYHYVTRQGRCTFVYPLPTEPEEVRENESGKGGRQKGHRKGQGKGPGTDGDREGETGDLQAEPKKGDASLKGVSTVKGARQAGKGGTRQLVGDGTRYRRQKIERDQPRLMPWLQERKQEQEAREGTKVRRGRDETWGPWGGGNQPVWGEHNLNEEVLQRSG